jgi:transposase InsO family protein
MPWEGDYPSMKVFSIAKGFYQLSKKAPPELSQKELDRLRALAIYGETRNVRLVCQSFGISRATLYRWFGQFDPKDLTSLREQSRRPRRVRKPMWSVELVRAVKKLREEYSRWGKDKLVVLVRGQGYKVSTSTVGRILKHLQQRGELREPKRKSISAKRKSRRPYGVKKPGDYKAEKPGDLVQVDTLDVRPFPWMSFKQFTARDVISKWDVIEVRRRATATTAKEFIETLEKRMPFRVKALQVDGGSEFYSDFEKECERRKIRLFVLPPKSPKLNGCVERAHRTHTEEFYEVYEVPWNVTELNPELQNWENIYNCVRPHQALDYKTPLQFLKDNGIVSSDYSPNLSHM